MRNLLFGLVVLLAMISGGDLRAQSDSDVTKGLEAARAGEYAVALDLLRPAAEAGNAIAQNAMGVFFNNGYGVEADVAEALRWYHLSAEQGYASAQYNLGLYYAGRDNDDPDDETALSWYAKAADQGRPEALFKLALHYAQGLGVDRDPERAEAFALEALEKGHPDARSLLNQIRLDSRAERSEPSASVSSMPVEITLPDGCRIVRKRADSWSCDYTASNGRFRRLLLDFQVIELDEQGQELIRSTSPEGLAELLNREIQGIDQRRDEVKAEGDFAKIRYEIMSPDTCPNGFAACSISRETIGIDESTGYADDASLHCWAAYPEDGSLGQLLLSLIEFRDARQDPSDTLAAEFDQIVRSIGLK